MRLFSKWAINDASDIGLEKVILIVIDDVQLKENRAGVPLTSMAAHVVDEEVDIELDDKIEKTETAPAEIENEVAVKARSLPLLPPTLTSGTNYSRVSSSPS